MVKQPWLRMWVKPRETIREIVATNPKYQFGLLSAVYGLPVILNFAQNYSLGDHFSLLWIVLIALVLSPFIGMLGITIMSGLLLWTGRWIGGTASYLPIRAAVSWSNVTNVVTIFVWIVFIALFGRSIFMESFPQTAVPTGTMQIVLGLFLIETVASIWSFVILLQGLSEVQGFSIWKALLNVIIPLIIIIMAMWLLAAVVSCNAGIPKP